MGGTSAYAVNSDIRWKKNIQLLENSLPKILNMTGVSYTYRSEEFPDKNFQEGVQIGFLAQDLEPIVPEVVHTDSEGWKSVQYSALVPVLVEAVKQQDRTIRQQESQIQTQQQNVLHLTAQVQQQNEEISTLRDELAEFRTTIDQLAKRL